MIKRYVILAYALFWALVMGLCGTASMVFHAPQLVMRMLSDITAWSPTFALLILFRKLLPETKLSDFLKKCFCGRLRLSLFLVATVVMLGGTFASVGIVSLLEGKPFGAYFSLGGYPFVASFFLSLFSGPMGEELGWRGYLRPELNQKYGFLKGSVVQGIIWAFWHALLWFVDSEFMDARMIVYVLSNVIVITSIALIMNVILEKENNLLYSVWIHFCFNLPYSFLQVGISYYAVMCAIFPILAVGAYLWHRKTVGAVSSAGGKSDDCRKKQKFIIY